MMPTTPNSPVPPPKKLRGIFTTALSICALLSFAISACSTGKETIAQPERQSASAPKAASPKPEPPPDAGQSLQELSVREEQGQTTLLVKFSQPVTQYRHFTLPQPARIVLDVLDASKVAPVDETYRIESNWVSVLRLNGGENNLRLVAEISAAAVPTYTIIPDNGGLKIVVGALDQKSTVQKNLTIVKDGKRLDLTTATFGCSATVADAKIPPPLPPRGSPAEKNYSGQRVSLEFKDADIKNVFRLLAEVSAKNILVTDEVNRKITVRLIEVPWDQALDLIVDTNGLAKEETGNVIRISTAARLTQDKKAQLDARNATLTAQVPQTSYINVNYAKAKDLVDKVKQIVKSGADIVPDERSNTIVVRGTYQDLQEVNCMVSRLDVRTPQVLIESNLIETNPTFARALGTKFNFTRGGTTITSDFTPTSGTAAAGVAPIISVFQNRIGGLTDLNATLTAAENEGLVKVISRPSVATLNNVESTIQSLRILRIALPSSTNIASGSGSAAGTAVATEKIPTGITLTVTPQVSSDGFILMKIGVKSSSVAPTASPSSGTSAAGVVPFDEISREAVANVLVRDGETIVVGGILKDSNTTNEAGIPWVKDIPVFGWLFKNNTWQKQFEEMMVFITPRIASAGSANLPTAEQLWRDQMKKTDGSQPSSSQGIP